MASFFFPLMLELNIGAFGCSYLFSADRLPLSDTGHKLVIKPGAFVCSYLFSVERWPHFYLRSCWDLIQELFGCSYLFSADHLPLSDTGHKLVIKPGAFAAHISSLLNDGPIFISLMLELNPGAFGCSYPFYVFHWVISQIHILFIIRILKNSTSMLGLPSHFEF